jgi:uncharacterized protein (TIGR00369 family)
MLHPILKLYNEINAFAKDHALHYEVIQPGEVHYRMTVEERHLATPTVIHGGMLAAFMDCVLGVAALSKVCQENKLVSTVEFKMNFLQPVQCGDQLLGTGKVIHQGKRISICTGDVINESTGTLVAKGMGTFNAYPVEKTGLDKRLS